MSTDLTALRAAYGVTRFRDVAAGVHWPEAFVIITACATTGSTWTPEREAAEDQLLRSALENRGVWHTRITGYHPETGHAEPGWAAELSVADGCALGRAYRQDAIYTVEGDELRVVLCEEPQRAERVGGFRERLDYSGTERLPASPNSIE
jgi:hypothetical protein